MRITVLCQRPAGSSARRAITGLCWCVAARCRQSSGAAMRGHVRFRVSWGRQFRETTLSRKWPCKVFRIKVSYSFFFCGISAKILTRGSGGSKIPRGRQTEITHRRLPPPRPHIIGRRSHVQISRFRILEGCGKFVESDVVSGVFCTKTCWQTKKS